MQYSNQSVLQRGFTLLELMITLVIAAVILVVALPSFRSLLSDSHMVATTNDLVTSVHIARSEAVKRGVPAGVCPTTTPSAADAICSTTAAWTSGWIAFSDDNSNGLRDVPGEDLLVQKDARSPGFVFTPTTNLSSLIYFASDGTSIASDGSPVAGTVNLKYGDNEERNVTISASGRVISDRVITETP